jgi:hypothetical protein
MKKFCRSLVVAFAFILLSTLSPADIVQKDPQNRFTVTVPLGWKITSADDAMKLTMGDSFVRILRIDGQTSSLKVLQAAVGLAGETFAAGQELDHGETTFGGEHAVFANFSAYDDRSVAMYLRFVATDSGWVFYAGSPQSGFTFLRQTFLNIEHSFQLTKAAAADPAPTSPHN